MRDCFLRTRLEHGEYPASLRDLANPPERDGLHDLLTGEAFVYGRTAFDRFSLTSGKTASPKRVVFD